MTMEEGKKQNKLITLLAIAGSDCCGGAGLQADIKAASLCNVYASTVVTAVTAQNSSGIQRIETVAPSMVTTQLNAIADDSLPDAVKIGMLGSLENGRAIVEFLRHAKEACSTLPIVVDPVWKATMGGAIKADEDEIRRFYLHELFPLATVITPNLSEDRFFLNPDQDARNCHEEIMSQTICEVDSRQKTEQPLTETDTVAETLSLADVAFRLLQMSGSESVLLTGGDNPGECVIDILALLQDDGKHKIFSFKNPKIKCHNLHGTGCTLSSLVASLLSCGCDIKVAVEEASYMMNKIIGNSTSYTYGRSGYGPLNMNNYKLKKL